ncbi:hypothetical protein NDU88_004511 [Pleurodeles waltl]|uniref:Uncharacterized protein n=1 Tax=Pleurodeles waltl TaxID=8319 RepID=A0AAV7WUW2_PLEWA|nr:hypothetical protein NDU88_004511 [Pleurodeles waltl]
MNGLAMLCNPASVLKHRNERGPCESWTGALIAAALNARQCHINQAPAATSVRRETSQHSPKSIFAMAMKQSQATLFNVSFPRAPIRSLNCRILSKCALRAFVRAWILFHRKEGRK